MFHSDNPDSIPRFPASLANLHLAAPVENDLIDPTPW